MAFDPNSYLGIADIQQVLPDRPDASHLPPVKNFMGIVDFGKAQPSGAPPKSYPAYDPATRPLMEIPADIKQQIQQEQQAQYATPNLLPDGTVRSYQITGSSAGQGAYPNLAGQQNQAINIKPIDWQDSISRWAGVGKYEKPSDAPNELRAFTTKDQIVSAIQRRKRAVANALIGADGEGGLVSFAKAADAVPAVYRELKRMSGAGGANIPVLDDIARFTGGIAKSEEEKFQQGVQQMKESGAYGSAGTANTLKAINDTMTFLATIRLAGLHYGGGAAEGATKMGKVLGVLKNAQKIALFQALTQEGASWQEKLDTYKIATLYMSTPAASGLLRSPAGVKAFDLALNSLISTAKQGGYKDIINDHEMDGFDKLMAISQTLGADVVFSALTKSIQDPISRKEAQNLQQIDQAVIANMRPQNAQRTMVDGKDMPNTPEVRAQAQGEQAARDIAEPLTPQEQQRLDWLKQNDYQQYNALVQQHGPDARAILRDAWMLPEIKTYDERGNVVDRQDVSGRQGGGVAASQQISAAEAQPTRQNDQRAPVEPAAAPAAARVDRMPQDIRLNERGEIDIADAWKVPLNDYVESKRPYLEEQWAGRSAEFDNRMRLVGVMHRAQVKNALKKGYDVPKEVLADYPDLAKEGGVQDLGRESRGTQMGGFVSVPDNAGLKRVAVGLGRFARRWFVPSQGMDANTRAAKLVREQGQEASRVVGWMTRNEFKAARRTLVAEHGREAVQAAMESVVYGDTTPADFARQFGLGLEHPSVKVLDGFVKARAEQQAKLAAMLDKTGNSALAERVRENDFYVSRFYLKHAMGKEFTPKPADYEAAFIEVKNGLEDALDSMLKRATKAAGRDFRGNVVDYLATGDGKVLDGLSASRRAEIETLGRSFKKLSRIISDVRDSGNGIEFEKDVAALDDAARATLDYYLNREGSASGGAVDVSNLKKRFLGEAFRKLYGEVRDPIFTAAATLENQSRMLAHLTFFNRLALDAENSSWSGTPSQELNTVKRLDNDRKRYGLLADKYVTPELYEAIHGEPARMGITRFYKSTLGTMRMLKLVGPKTIWRNYATGLTGFALGSGDMMRPGYWDNFARGNKLMAGIVKGDPAALAELRDLVDLGAFSFHGNTQMQEIQQLFSMDPRKKLAAGIQKLGDYYSLIDLPTKAAAFYTNLDMNLKAGMPMDAARQAAAEHVQKFYQNPRALPKGVMTLSRLPFSDYPGYFADSIRIRANQAAHAVKMAQQGDLLPAAGLVLSMGVSVGLATVLGDEGRKLWRSARQKLARRDKDIVATNELQKQQTLAIRDFVPDYYRDTPMVMWSEKRKDGTTRLYYTVTGGNGAFPVEDMLMGALQGSDSPGQFLQHFGRSFVDNRFGPGMLPNAIWKAVTGDDISGNFHTAGPSDVWGTIRPDKRKIYLQSAERLLSDVYGGQFGYKLMQLNDVAKKQKAGLEPVAGSYTPYQNSMQVWGSMIDPVRTYEITTDQAAAMVRNKIKQYQDGIGVSKRMAGAEMKSYETYGKTSPDAQQTAQQGQQFRAKYIADVGQIVQRARVAFGPVLDDRLMAAVIKDALPNVSNLEMLMIMVGAKEGGVVPYIPERRQTNLQKAMMGQ